MIYRLQGFNKTGFLFINGKRVRFKPSYKVAQHYHEYKWGENVPQAALKQIALGVMMHITGTYEGYHKLYYEIIKNLPNGDFVMEFTMKWKEKETSARHEAILNAQAYNKYLTYGYLSKKPNEELICFVHPLERQELATKLNL